MHSPHEPIGFSIARVLLQSDPSHTRNPLGSDLNYACRTGPERHRRDSDRQAWASLSGFRGHWRRGRPGIEALGLRFPDDSDGLEALRLRFPDDSDDPQRGSDSDGWNPVMFRARMEAEAPPMGVHMVAPGPF